MTFSFRNLIRLQDNKRLNIEAESYDLTDENDGERVVLQSGERGKQIKDVAKCPSAAEDMRTSKVPLPLE